MNRPPGLSVRLKLTLSYAGFLMIAGILLLAAVWLFLLRDLSVFQVPRPVNFARVFVPGSFGPYVFVPAAIMVLGFLLLFGLVGGWILARRMLEPLDRITDATRTAARGSLSHRIALEGHNDEFHELADAFDNMLTQLEAHVEAQRRFAANASHELRTPLAITKTLLDVASNDPERDSDDLIERLQATNARAIVLTESLLLLSRADHRTFAREHVDLSLIAEETAETQLSLAEKHNVTIETSGDIAPTFGSRALLTQLTANLVHNAIVYNLPHNGIVNISTRTGIESVELVVENTGKVLAPGSVSMLVEPFQRGEKRHDSGDNGVGLGLAIVDSITRAHDGTLSLTPRPNGGLIATVRMPRSQ
ncbi:MAG: HAMP domain-containing histidine kinase [Thermomicrobiales bacterium]|nr:HAMP domain-containing histidine kinase [Thermomicrobiales bacterium]